MEGFLVRGGERLSGALRVDAAKNAVLPIMAAAILPTGRTLIEDCPAIGDVESMRCILHKLGCETRWTEAGLEVDNAGLHGWEMPEHLSKRVRSSIFMLGPILGKLRRATMAYPGGCEIGLRPIDLHLSGLRRMGVEIRDECGQIFCDGSRMHAADVHLDYPSVGATENVMLCAVLLPGRTTITNAAREPEIEDLQAFLNAMGARVRGAGTQTVVVEGVEALRGVRFAPMPDRIAAGTYLCAAAITAGEIELTNTRARHLTAVTEKLREMGCRVWEGEGSMRLAAPARLTAFNALQTQPHPGFPTDMQSQMLTLAAVARGGSMVVENVFENRFTHVGDLCRMGANIRVSGRAAFAQGVDALYGTSARARDLRGGAALVLAGLYARGQTLVEDIACIDRGYAAMDEKLTRLGARIRRVHLREPYCAATS